MNESDESLFACPCCEGLVFHEPGAHELCPQCGWEDDALQSSDPDFAGGANPESLNEARRRWQARPASRRGPASG